MAGDSKQLAFDSLKNGRLGFDTDQENAIRNAITLFHEQGIPLEATLGLLPTDAKSPINRAIQTSISALSVLGHKPKFEPASKQKQTPDRHRLIFAAYFLLPAPKGTSHHARCRQIAEATLKAYQNKNTNPRPKSEYELLIQKIVASYGKTICSRTVDRAVNNCQNLSKDFENTGCYSANNLNF